MPAMIRHYQTSLARLTRKHRQRELTSQKGVDFTSNDYLALANSSLLRTAIRTALDQGIALGAGGSRLLRGNHQIFEELEHDAATFFKSERTLFFNSGYCANTAIFSTLPRPSDMIFYDEKIHASVLDGIKLSRTHGIAFNHNDINALATLIHKWRQQGGVGNPWIAVESLYSMDGDFAPLTSLLALTQQHNGFLIIDEAHATGVYGSEGEGLAQFPNDTSNVIPLNTFCTALGVSGAFVCLNKTFYAYLINRARPFIYSTAPSPLIAVGVSQALELIKLAPALRTELLALITYANKALSPFTHPHGSQILPVLLGDDARALRISQSLQAFGFDIRAIRPPTVPSGTARLRISITRHVTKSDIDNLVKRLKIILKEEK